MAYQPKIRKARFVYSPFSAEQMIGIGNVMVETIVTRIKSGVNAEDNPSKMLKPGYAKFKSRHGYQPIRNWLQVGKVLGSLKVMRASENSVTIGFITRGAQAIARLNNRRETAFAISPNDRQVLTKTVQEALQQSNMVSVKAGS